MNVQKQPAELTFRRDTKEHYAAAGIIFQKKYQVEIQILMGWFKKIAPRKFAKPVLVVYWTNVTAF